MMQTIANYIDAQRRRRPWHHWDFLFDEALIVRCEKEKADLRIMREHALEKTSKTMALELRRARLNPINDPNVWI